MGAYLTDHPPVRDQWYERRTRDLTGCTVLHTAESVMDTVGPDTGAEAVAEFIRTRTTPGSYHDLVDSDTAIYLVDYSHGAYHDGTGSNNWALSISWACATTDWDRMTPEKRRAFLRQGAIAFARQQAWRKAHGYPLTELRLISKAQSDAGVSGFTYHGFRDPGRRSDPGVAEPNLFPFTEFITECRAVMSGEEDDMPLTEDDLDRIMRRVWRGAVFTDPATGKETLFASAFVETTLNGRKAAADAAVARKLAEEAAKAGTALSQADIDRIIKGTAAEVDERIAAGYDILLEPKGVAAPAAGT